MFLRVTGGEKGKRQSQWVRDHETQKERVRVRGGGGLGLGKHRYDYKKKLETIMIRLVGQQQRHKDKSKD
jgi:hypothetical protein